MRTVHLGALVLVAVVLAGCHADHSRSVSTASTMGGDTVYVVMEIDDEPYVVIQAAADRAWGTGSPRGPFESGVHLLAKLDARAAPAAARWISRPLVVFDAAGNACDAAVGEMELIAGGRPHFGEIQRWEGDVAASEDGRVWPPAERARALWDMSSPYLVGKLTITGACKPVVAVDPTARVEVFRRAPVDSVTRATSIAAIMALAEYSTLQEKFEENHAGQGGWAPDPTVASFVAGSRAFVVVSASEGLHCSDFLGRLMVVFESRDGKLALVSSPAEGFERVDLILDGDGDRQVELIGTLADFRMITAHFVPAAVGFTAATAVSFPNNDCSC